MLHKTNYGLVYNDDGSLCVTHQEDGAVAVEEGTTNLLTPNQRSAETDTSDWATAISNLSWAVASYGKTTAESYHGYASIYATTSGTRASEGVGQYVGTIVGEAGKTFTLSVYVKAPVGTKMSLSLRDNNAGTASTSFTATGQWQRVSVTRAAHATIDPAWRWSINVEEPAAVTFYVDAVQLEAKPFATSFVDGSRSDGIIAYPVTLPDDYTIACYRKSHTDEDYRHVVKRSDGKVFVDGVEDSGYDVGWIAGRNLIQRQYMLDWVNVVTDTDEIGYYYEAQISSLYPIAFPNLEFEENTQYTISGKVKWISGNANGLYFQYSDGTTQTIFRLYNTESVKEFSVTSAKGKTVTGIGAYWSTGGKTRYYDLKLEKGPTATHWTPAPEDLGYDGDLLMFSNHTGYIKDLKILPYIATDKEIKQMYSGGTFDVTDKGIVIADNYSELGPMSGIIGYWPLDGHTQDYSGNNNHGTNNGATITSGIRGSAYSFDGSSSYIELSQPMGDLFSNSFTVSMWCYFNDDSRGILFGDYQRPNASGINLEKNTSRRLRFYWNGAPDINSPTNAVPLQEWCLVAFTRDKLGAQVTMWVNGVNIHTYSGEIVDKTASSLHLIGRDNRTGTTTVDGKIADVRIYNRALSPEEIKILYNVTKPNAIPMQLSSDGIVYPAGELKEV